MERLKKGNINTIERPKIRVPLPDIDPDDLKRRQTQYGDFSRMNARWNASYSSTIYQRLIQNPEEWMQYHILYQEARKKWQIIPYQETIKWLQKRSNPIIGDFGRGEAKIAEALYSKYTICSFDFIAINESVIECDIAKVPLEDSCLDVAVFNLSLMGINAAEFIKEATRTLKLDGQLWVYEANSNSRIKDISNFINYLELSGFRIIDNREDWKFYFIRAIKSEEIDLNNFLWKFKVELLAFCFYRKIK